MNTIYSFGQRFVSKPAVEAFTQVGGFIFDFTLFWLTLHFVLKTAPPLIVEVVSPESIDRSYNIKTLEYAAIGVNEYWIVDPLEDKVTVCLLAALVYNQRVFTGNQQIVSLT